MGRNRFARVIRAGLPLAAFALFAAGSAQAVTLYKLVDADGRVSYVDRVPRGFAGKVVPLEIDTSALPTLSPAATPEAKAQRRENERIIRERPPRTDDSQVRSARAQLEAAQAALDAAQESASPDDWIYFGCRRPPGGCRAPRPEYEARLAQLEGDVKLAEDRLAVAEQRYREGS
jgi:hypothetical protein